MISDKSLILPVAYPPITTYSAFAATLSILYSHEESYDWVFSHYLQIYAVSKTDLSEPFPPGGGPYKVVFFGDMDNRRLTYSNCEFMFFSKESCQYLDLFEVPCDLFNSYNESFVSFIKRSIDMNMYLYLYVDQSKISAFKRTNGYVHPLFIFGYDDCSATVHVADFVGGKFTYFKASYIEIENAYQSGLNIPNYVNHLPKDSESIALIRYTNYAPFVFDYSYIQDTICEYIYPDKSKVEKFNNYIMSRHSFRNQDLKTYMGVDVYQYISDLIELQLNAGAESINHRIYHAMYDHKEMMLKRFEYFLQRGYIDGEKLSFINEYKKVRDIALVIRNLILKLNITQDRKVVERIVSQVRRIRELETVLLKQIFNIS